MEQPGKDLQPPWRLEQLGKDLEAHHSLYKGGAYDDPEWQTETGAVLHPFPRFRAMSNVRCVRAKKLGLVLEFLRN